MTHTVTLIPGDGLGHELAPVMQRILAATGVDIEWDVQAAGHVAAEASEEGDPVPPAVLASIRERRVALKGRLDTPERSGYQSPDKELREALGLYAVHRPVRNLPGLPSRFEGVDILMVREGTEDVYAGIEHEVVSGVIQSIKVTTRQACLRICRHAFGLARARGRKTVTLVHKANIMKKADGLFLRCGEEVSRDFPEIAFTSMIADNACMQMVRAPGQFDVLVSQNLFGDILSNLGAGIVGGKGAVWGELHGDDDLVVFEVLHGLAPEIEGRGVASPLPFLLPGRALLAHLGEEAAADRLEQAIEATLAAGVRTADLGGTATTAEMESAILTRIDARSATPA